MAKISFGGLLRNPLVLGVLGTEVASNLGASYMNAEKQRQEEEKFQAEKAQVIGQATGVAPTSLPTTGIQGLFSKIGLADKTKPLTPYESAAGQAGVVAGQMAKTQVIMEAIAKRPIVGPGEGWQNFSKEFTDRTGLPLPDLSAKTPKELAEGAGGKLVFFSKDGKQQDYAVPYRKGETVFAPPGYGLSKAPKPELTDEEIKKKARLQAEGRGEGGENVYFNGDASMQVHGMAMYDADLNPITKPGVTREQALAAGGASYGPKEQMSIAEAKGLDKEFSTLRLIINGDPANKIPPRLLSTKDGSFQVKGKLNHAALSAAAGSLLPFGIISSTDPAAYNLVYGPQTIAISLARLMTQQRLNQQEINAVKARLGNLAAMPREVANANLDWAQNFVDSRLKTRIKASADDTASKVGADFANSAFGVGEEAPAEAPTEQPPDESETPPSETYEPGSPINADNP